MTVRAAAHAGLFYPAKPPAIRAAIGHYLDGAREGYGGDAVALVAPHAGWRYCGPVMAGAFRGLQGRRVRRVIHLGPSHYQAISGVVAGGVSAVETPLGAVPVLDVARDGVTVDAGAHASEHAFEVQLPFLQTLLGTFEYIPLLVGECDPEALAVLLETLGATEPDVVTIVSSDLSHYLPAPAARATDLASLRQIEALHPTLDATQACGAVALNGVIALAMRAGWSATAIDRRDANQTANISPDKVVGYAALSFHRREQ